MTQAQLGLRVSNSVLTCVTTYIQRDRALGMECSGTGSALSLVSTISGGVLDRPLTGPRGFGLGATVSLLEDSSAEGGSFNLSGRLA